MKKLLFLLISAVAFSCTNAQLVTNVVMVDSPAHVVFDYGKHVLGTQINGIGIARRVPGDDWFPGIAIGDYTNDYGTLGQRHQLQIGVFNPITGETANICFRRIDSTGELFVKELLFDGTNKSSREWVSGGSVLYNINGCKYQLPEDCGEGVLYNSDNNEPMTFRPTVLDSVDAYHVIHPVAGQTLWCSDCTNGTPQPGVYLVHDGTMWRRLN